MVRSRLLPPQQQHLSHIVHQEVTYGSGAFEGEEVEDDVTLGDLTITDQSLGAATESEGLTGVDGIIGFVVLVYHHLNLPIDSGPCSGLGPRT